ncbi:MULTISPECIES: DUF6265 family protein [Tenacibaculum]|uniref:DUF6265 family protein n=1 Tax=Tenacibaculum TaxID=104267 RepID=UPI000899B8A6|nr:DUF6265 family protein [Tenacibaculum sp. MAR_2010_89]SED58365.1 hypothetical protein SAMN04487765_0421 [Tenacibaculum sp. MAR_2010_89]
MRFLFLFLCVTLILSCKSNTLKPTFLIGKWQRINDKPNQITYENWNSSYKGSGFTLKKGDTIFKEILTIETINDTLHLKVTGVNNKPTLFKFIQQTDSSFICENKLNEFPKKIKYWKNNSNLHAQVSNDSFKIDFTFKKLN